MIRKNLLLFVIVLTFSLVLSACGSSNHDEGTFSAGRESDAALSQEGASSAPENAEPVEEAESEKTEAAEEVTEDGSENNGNILIAYFSHTGNTREAARAIADYTGGELAEIKRTQEYEDLQEEAEVEIKDGVHPEITVSISNVEDYDTIFVGYPIWWDEAPAMIATFLTENDFSGKTIIPFCTSSSDDIGNSLHIFSELCPDAEIAEGLTANDLNDIEPWLTKLGLI